MNIETAPGNLNKTNNFSKVPKVPILQEQEIKQCDSSKPFYFHWKSSTVKNIRLVFILQEFLSSQNYDIEQEIKQCDSSSPLYFHWNPSTVTSLVSVSLSINGYNG